METRRRLTVSGILILIVVVALALAAGFTLAQGSGPEGEIDAPSGPEDTTEVSSVVPIQGRLTDADGNPLTGLYVIRAALYTAPTGGTMLCSGTKYVTVDNGLFNMYLDSGNGCTSAVIDGKQFYLGITVGNDPEMTPRQEIYPVPYAWSLRPGAVISGTTSNAIVHIENWDASGRGLRAYAMSQTGTNYGIVGVSRSPNGFGGYFYNHEGGTGLYGEGTTGVYGVSTADDGVHGVSTTGNGVYGEGTPGVYGVSAAGYGVHGVSTTSNGVRGVSTSNIGVYGDTNRSDQSYGLYTPDNLYSANIHSTGARMQIVQNGGKTSLEIGDVVAFSGIGAPLEADGTPIIQVASADSANSTAVAGVVYSRYNIDLLSADPDKVAPDVIPEGPVAPGEYLLVVVQGPVQVKASALSGPLQPGDLLSSANQAGYAAKASTVTFGDTEIVMPGTVLGKVLEPLDEGEALIYIFVTLQ